jgi:hypothetical protein
MAGVSFEKDTERHLQPPESKIAPPHHSRLPHITTVFQRQIQTILTVRPLSELQRPDLNSYIHGSYLYIVRQNLKFPGSLFPLR